MRPFLEGEQEQSGDDCLEVLQLHQSICGSGSRLSTSQAMAASLRTMLFFLRLLDSLHKNDPKKRSSNN